MKFVDTCIGTFLMIYRIFCIYCFSKKWFVSFKRLSYFFLNKPSNRISFVKVNINSSDNDDNDLSSTVTTHEELSLPAEDVFTKLLEEVIASNFPPQK